MTDVDLDRANRVALVVFAYWLGATYFVGGASVERAFISSLAVYAIIMGLHVALGAWERRDDAETEAE